MGDLKEKDILSIEQLREQLEGAGIDTSIWGTGEAKTLANLQREIEHGETVLTTGETGELMRKVVMGGADIYYESPNGVVYRLKEEKQVFNDGRERRRDYGHAVSEKMKPNEDAIEGMIRGIQEELGIGGAINLVQTDEDEQTLMSPSYPGLKSQYLRYKFRALLNDEQYCEEGYIEEDYDKTTYFVWEEVNTQK